MWEERKRRENTTQGDDIHLRQRVRGGLLFRKELIEKLSNVMYGIRPAVRYGFSLFTAVFIQPFQLVAAGFYMWRDTIW